VVRKGSRLSALGSRPGGSRLSAFGSRLGGSGLSALGSRRVRDVVGALESFLGHLGEPDREARELIAALFDAPKYWPLVHADRELTDAEATALASAAEKRARGAPLAYAVGRASFRHLTLAVDERVLIPRPETELLIDLVLNRCVPGGIAVDVGTGSGAIAIALATEGDFARVIATDLSADAIDVARGNAAQHDAAVDFRAGDLLQALDAGVPKVRAVVSNPPYIAFEETSALPRSVRDWEPPLALFSGHNGLALTARLVRQAATRLEVGGLLALEVDARRASLVAELVASDERYRNVGVQLDLAGRERFVLATRMERA
jgi:release factor glutamine methyltransferase